MASLCLLAFLFPWYWSLACFLSLRYLKSTSFNFFYILCLCSTVGLEEEKLETDKNVAKHTRTRWLLPPSILNISIQVKGETYSYAVLNWIARADSQTPLNFIRNLIRLLIWLSEASCVSDRTVRSAAQKHYLEPRLKESIKVTCQDNMLSPLSLKSITAVSFLAVC